MKHLEVKTTAQITTRVTINNGQDVEEFLKEVCDLAHIALVELSAYRIDHNLPEDEFECIEGEFCQLLDKLGD